MKIVKSTKGQRGANEKTIRDICILYLYSMAQLCPVHTKPAGFFSLPVVLWTCLRLLGFDVEAPLRRVGRIVFDNCAVENISARKIETGKSVLR